MHDDRRDDHRDDHRALHRTRDAVLSGARADGGSAPDPRAVIEASWRRMRRRGLDPCGGPTIAPLAEQELEARRARSGLSALVPRMRAALAPALDQGDLLMVVTDTEGRVLWRTGDGGVRRRADRLGFVGGSAWTEGNVGTNAIGTCLVLGAPVQIRGPEHFVDSHTAWSCAAAPVHDPWTGRTLGVVDVSGAPRSMHPMAETLVQLAARVAMLEVREQHHVELDRLRAHAAPLVARVGGRSLVVDRHGHIAAVSGMTAPDAVSLPADMAVGELWLPRLGRVSAEALPGGWLLRVEAPHEVEQAGSVTLDLTGPGPLLTVRGPSGSWTHGLSPRHTEIVVALLVHPEGRSAAELADDLFADPARVVTVRAEMSRLRRILGPLLGHQPYRVLAPVVTELVLPEDASAVLPGSSAPVLARVRSARFAG